MQETQIGAVRNESEGRESHRSVNSFAQRAGLGFEKDRISTEGAEYDAMTGASTGLQPECIHLRSQAGGLG